MADIGIYAEGLDIIITGESSYHSADYYARIDGITRQDMEEKRSIPGSVALSRYAGRGTVSRILSTEPVLAFVSSLPLNTQAGESYAFFHLNADRLAACLPESDAGTLLLADAEGNPVLAAGTPDSGEACRQYMRDRQNRIRIGGSEYGVLGLETASDGLFCMAVIPTSELLKPSLRLRDTVMLVMGSCMVIGLLGAVLASKRLYAPLERLIGNVRQMCHSLPEETRGNEYKILDDAIHTITAENHELTLSNREVNRLLKNRLLNDWMEGRLRGSAAEMLAKAGVDLPYDRVQAAVAEMSPRDLERLEMNSGMNTADRMEELAAAEDRGPMKIWCARRTDGRILILFNLDAEYPDPGKVPEILGACRGQLLGDCPCAVGTGGIHGTDQAAEALVEAMIDLRSGEESREKKHYARLTDYIRREYMHEISLDSAGEALGMSPSYIGLVFRKVGKPAS